MWDPGGWPLAAALLLALTFLVLWRIEASAGRFWRREALRPRDRPPDRPPSRRRPSLPDDDAV
jgi:hypothetical protein